MSDDSEESDDLPLQGGGEGELAEGDEHQCVRSPRCTQLKPSMRLEDIAQLLGTCVEDIEELRQKQEQIRQRQEGAESVRRGQLDCMTERIFKAEKDLRQAEERQHDAIEKASAAFQKHACEVEQERQNLMCVIGQVNQNFEHISGEIAQHGFTISTMEQSIVQLQSSVAQSNLDSRNSVLNLGRDVTMLEHALREQQQQGSIQLLEHTLQLQQQQLKDLQSNMHNVHDVILRYTDTEARHRELSARFSELEAFVSDSQEQQKAVFGNLSEIRDQVSLLADTMARAMSAKDMQQEMGPPGPTSRRPALATPHQGEWLPPTTHSLGQRHRLDRVPHNGQAAEAFQMVGSPHEEHRSPALPVTGLLGDGDEGTGASPSRSAKRDSKSQRYVESFRPGMDMAGAEELLHHQSGLWQDSLQPDRFEPLTAGDVDDYVQSEVARFATAPMRSCSRERPRVPDPSAVPAPVMEWGGNYIGL